MSLKFEWDPWKATDNLDKHGVSFAEASTVFADTLSLVIPDPDHSIGEARYLIVGMSHKSRLLVVSHTENEDEDLIGIISARPANSTERRRYE